MISDCALIIDITSVSGGVGTFTVSAGPSFAQGPYDGLEDTLLGVTNSSGATVNSIHLSSTLDIGGFDGDGLETYNGRPSSGLPQGGSTGYEGSISTTGAFNLAGPLDCSLTISAPVSTWSLVRRGLPPAAARSSHSKKR